MELKDFAKEIVNWDEQKVFEWTYNYLIHGSSAPWYGGYSKDGIQPAEYLAEILQLANNATLTGKFKKAISRLYGVFSKELSGADRARAGCDLLELVARVDDDNLTGLLKEDALSGKFKGTDTKYHGDLHSRLLLSLYGTHARKLDRTARKDLIALVERDIKDNKYSLDCFGLACILWGSDALKYMPTQKQTDTGTYFGMAISNGIKIASLETPEERFMLAWAFGWIAAPLPANKS